ncbi:MAG: hypothetical protein KTR25_18385, partial [Myxococcales bacterium]|nr:hypothetical protein [Myxococcales bacterium]
YRQKPDQTFDEILRYGEDLESPHQSLSLIVETYRCAQNPGRHLFLSKMLCRQKLIYPHHRL